MNKTIIYYSLFLFLGWVVADDDGPPFGHCSVPVFHPGNDYPNYFSDEGGDDFFNCVNDPNSVMGCPDINTAKNCITKRVSCRLNGNEFFGSCSGSRCSYYFGTNDKVVCLLGHMNGHTHPYDNRKPENKEK
ncbi:hypothetical protein [endosymbiont GvMRE of Glomus versiforme]|uniref:hypothetical protein n=1 Tax=endosymbiont GvMRE of Glomus versiforme TaxID=2039283 RepID=UPI000ED4F3AF|nr:hypothetical protein [endosymbiont GvMRE of Glomus versiforme]RHZ35176.1 hypothetical protein GvMRE_IIg57 [endosymbiont GvMRE of Glomus versiforme]